MFIEVLFVIGSNYPMPIKIGWTTKLWYISKKKFYSAIRMYRCQLYRIRMNLANITWD